MTIRLITFISCFYLAFASSYVYATAFEYANDWTADLSRGVNNTLDIVGKKATAAGEAVSNVVRKANIDLKRLDIKDKMGAVMRSRIFESTAKGGLWGVAGSAAVAALLDSLDWVMDPATQTIWRTKEEGGVVVGCSVRPSAGFIREFSSPRDTSQKFKCAIDAANRDLQKRQEATTIYSDYEFLRWEQTTDFKTGASFGFVYTVISTASGAKEEKNSIVNAATVPTTTTPAEKEYLDNKGLAEVMTGEATDLPTDKRGTWTGVTEVFTPENAHEKAHSPTAQEVVKELDKAVDTSLDTEVKPNPTTGGSTLPNFCSWAVTLCEFMNWAKKDTPITEDGDVEIKKDEETLVDIDPDKRYVTWNAQCPPDEHVTFQLQGQNADITFSWSPWCQLLVKIRPAIIACAYIGAAYILLGNRQ